MGNATIHQLHIDYAQNPVKSPLESFASCSYTVVVADSIAAGSGKPSQIGTSTTQKISLLWVSHQQPFSKMKVSESGGFKERILISSNQFHPQYNTKSERKKLALFWSNLLENFGDKRDLCFKKSQNSKISKSVWIIRKGHLFFFK